MSQKISENGDDNNSFLKKINIIVVTWVNVFVKAARQRDRHTFGVISKCTPDLYPPEIPLCPPTSKLVFSSLPLAWLVSCFSHHVFMSLSRVSATLLLTFDPIFFFVTTVPPLFPRHVCLLLLSNHWSQVVTYACVPVSLFLFLWCQSFMSPSFTFPH